MIDNTKKAQKPLYFIPLCNDLKPKNYYKIVSTFSGGGGSCLGYKMAGYTVLYANEFVEEAQKTYRANFPEVYLDTRDVRQVKPEEILNITGLKVGELDLFDGSPPCCAFSDSNRGSSRAKGTFKRENEWNKKRNYSDGKVQQVENLFFEYIRILKGLQPKTFVAENVGGLVRGVAVGWFKEFLQGMKDCGYQVRAQLLNSQWLGVPQSRKRLIFIGVRNDLGMQPEFPKPLPYFYTVGDALNGVQNNPDDIKELLEEFNKHKWGEVGKMLPLNPPKPFKGSRIMNGSYFNLSRESMYAPCLTICQSNGRRSASGNLHPLENRKFSIPELKRITSVPDDFILTGTYEQQWERLGRMVPPIMMMNIAHTIQTEILDKI